MGFHQRVNLFSFIDVPVSIRNQCRRLRIVLAVFSCLPLPGCLSVPGDRGEDLPENRYVGKADFQRIGEYFTGAEVAGNRVYLRSEPGRRAGWYWIIPADDVASEDGVDQAVLEIQIPGSPAVKTFSFRMDRPVPENAVFWIGLTGGDWPDPELRPVAWRIGFLSPAGGEIHSRESVLWSPPDPDEDGDG